MNSEIKFRIWADNQFYYKCLVGNTNDTDDKKYTCPVVWLDDRKEWVNCDNGIISQYVGLKDKNGVEVYENMILDNKYIVLFENCKYILKDISNGNIIDLWRYMNENRGEITKEYSKI